MQASYILHGCVDDWHRGAQAMRMYAPADRLRRHLERRDDPYVDPDRDETGDVLTIDDSTRGAADACLMARALGHHVTLFVNPWQIASGRDYWFSRFDALVDGRRATEATIGRTTYDLTEPRGLYDFRWAIRPQLVIADEPAAHRLLDEVALLLRAETATVPEFARPIRLDDLLALRAAGVRLGNHGWDHRCITGLSPDEQHAQFAVTADWLLEHTGTTPRDYAVPFGQAIPAPAVRAAVSGAIYLVQPHAGAAEPACRYRINLTPSLQREADQGARP